MIAPAPTQIGRYRVESELGRGAAGLVYRAYDPKISRVVAIKLLRSDVLTSDDREQYLKRFSQEARAAGGCRHPNIVVIHDFATHEGAPFLVMEFVDGIGLDRALRRDGRFAPDAAVAIMLQVLDALDAAHSLGIVHRDVKPANILLLPNGQVKVTDFGIARLSGSDVTPDGTMLGTPAYMSPEQCRGESVDLRSDLFSAGSVLYELLSGAKPFAGDSYASTMQHLLAGEPEDIGQLVPDLPDGLVTAVRKSLAKQREARFSSAWAMADALRGVARRASPAADTVIDHTVIRSRLVLPAATIDRLEHALTMHVGPIARLLLRRTMASVSSEAELYHRLASRIDSAPDRDAFLRECGC